jgi:hypothetical protein
MIPIAKPSVFQVLLLFMIRVWDEGRGDTQRTCRLRVSGDVLKLARTIYRTNEILSGAVLGLLECYSRLDRIIVS